MGVLPYYMLIAFASWALTRPWLLLAMVPLFFLQRWLPNPVRFVQRVSRTRLLEIELEQNPQNVTALRDLAVVWLERRAPQKALPFLERALGLEPDSAELSYLVGRARYEMGALEAALAPLVEAAERNPRLLYGAPYLVASKALFRLGRFEEAEDAAERYLAIHSSSVEGRVMLAHARRANGDVGGAREALTQAVETFRQVPRFRQRTELGWYVRSRILAVRL